MLTAIKMFAHYTGHFIDIISIVILICQVHVDHRSIRWLSALPDKSWSWDIFCCYFGEKYILLRFICNKLYISAIDILLSKVFWQQKGLVDPMEVPFPLAGPGRQKTHELLKGYLLKSICLWVWVCWWVCGCVDGCVGVWMGVWMGVS